ncbi:unnamed protein product [Brugia timori]|uniref:C3H1-type domain-containing protein n=1 Tax=Brugia timori TaxID=42155 RepID=A0A0R3R2V6_9BILA|nr:unnamed protein product [Brugia timori]
MSSDQQKKGSSLEKKSSAPNYYHGATSQSARYGYRRFQNAPKKQLKLQKSLAVTNNDEIESMEHSSTTVPISSANVEGKGLTKRRNNGAFSALSLKISKRKVCKYFATENSCYFGEYCRFLHIRDENIDNNFDSVPSHINPKPKRIVVRPNITAISRDDIGKTEQLDIRNSEFNYFGRRFHDAKFAYDGSSYFIEFDYKITDPDWVFDVKTIGLRLKIPEHYPCELLMVTLNQPTLPVPLASHFNKEVKKFLEEKFMEAKKCDTYVGIGKMFIRWLDRNILKFFVEGLRKTKMIAEAEKEGIKLHQASFSNLINQKENTDTKTDKMKVEVCDSAEVTQSRNYNEARVESSSKTEIAMEEINSKQSPKGKAIQARIFWNDLNGNIATLSIITMAVSIKCAKCNSLSFLICSVKQLSTSHCKKCLNGSSIHISPQLVHQNSNVIALLEPKGCIPVDCVLLSSKLSYTCLQCSKEATVENLTYGVSNKSWCYGCHSKCEFEIRTIRFVGDFNAIEKEDSSVPKGKVSQPYSFLQLFDFLDHINSTGRFDNCYNIYVKYEYGTAEKNTNLS